ncbi:MAG: substrate-binding domain-containing protein [Peptoniphilaceae bacterium]
MEFKNVGKKIALGALVGTMMFSVVACGNNAANNADKNNTNVASEETADNKLEGTINVISREQGSGTRGAFTEITGILAKNDAGEETDNTSEEAVVQNSTDAVMTTVASDNTAIGYISLGSLNDTVKAVKVEGVEATPENIKSGEYKIARPFNILYKEGVSEEVMDFLKYIKTDEGQKIVEAEGYVPEMTGEAYQGSGSSAQITIAGSTSVTPLMEKLVEGYQKFNPEFKADIQATGSSAGIKAAQEGTAEIGMASRELKDSETGIEKEVIAMDGIAVIVNKESSLEDLTLENIKDIFEGTIGDWSEVNGK